MAKIILLNKPYKVMCQFVDHQQRETLKNYIDIPCIYPAGRLDFDSEGLLLLTDDGLLQHQISDPKYKLAKSYWVQVEGIMSTESLTRLASGITLKDGLTKPAKVKPIELPTPIWPRKPPIRERKTQPTSWIELTITEGRNRQVRRMTAAVGHPTLRLIRHKIGHWNLGELLPGQFRQELIHSQKPAKNRTGLLGNKPI
jgi:23S rRNA pseudouridine2457 synthase